MDYATRKQIEEIRAVRKKIYDLSIQHQLEQIKRISIYSDAITPHIKQYNELYLFHTRRLRETYITRPTIVRYIDFDLWIDSEGCTNLELMKKGCAPYEYDAPEGKIELHHIGQKYDAPFAELSMEEHKEYSKLLHPSKKVSWRSDSKLENAFYAERAEYWKKRASGDYVISEYRLDHVPPYNFQEHSEYMIELRKTCEVLYGQCDAENLDYLADLAKSFAMMQRVGANTLGEFLQKSRSEKQAKITCVTCGSSDCVCNGTYQTERETVQRYKCRRCGKVFSPFQKSLVSGSSFSFREWIKFIDCVYHGYSNKQIAKACDISEHSAHENKIKLFYALKLLNDKVTLKGNVVLDETYLPLSFKGNHTKEEDFVMPREAHERGGENHKAGISDNLVCIICAVDDCGNSVAKVAGIGASTAGKLKYALKEHLSDNTLCLYSDKSKVIRSFAKDCGLEIKQEKLLRKGTKRAKGVPSNKDTFITNRYLQIVNSYHSRLKKFLNRFSGISTKYLSGYLYLFAWKERSKDWEPEEAYRELLRIMTEPNHYLSVDDIIRDGHIPEAKRIEDQYRKGWRKNPEGDEEIYRRYANGETMTSIAADLGVSRQSISQTIQKIRKEGKAYRTEWDIQREKRADKPQKSPIPELSLESLERDYKIYAERQIWTGSSAEFTEKMAKEHHLSIQSIRNILSRMKRIQRLKEEIFIYEDVTYQTMGDVYRSVYSDYIQMDSDEHYVPYEKRASRLGEKYGCTAANITRIIQIMSSDTEKERITGKHRLTSAETYNRDKALFIDFLRWTGTRAEFYEHAAKKYDLAPYYVYIILKYCLYADPKRYEMI